MTDLSQRVHEAAVELLGRAPQVIVRAPGRVNLIGEHTDYNGGLVLPMAIERAVWIAFEPLDDARIELHSLDYNETRTFDIGNPIKGAPGWIEYVKGVAWAFVEAGYAIRGLRGVLVGDVPQGAGLSSSAALECAVAKALIDRNALPVAAKELAVLARRAENGWVGVQCGIMDQMISATGVRGKAVMLDCRTLDLTPVSLPHDVCVAILDTRTRRELNTSAYNTRRAECEAGAKALGVDLLGDAQPSDVEVHCARMPDVVYRRARHVVTECERVRGSARALAECDSVTFGRLMNESHASLRDDFEVSCRELDAMQAIATQQPGCFGARMTGAGFGGCAVALVQADHADAFAERTAQEYTRATGLSPAIYLTRATSGAQAWNASACPSVQ